MRSDSDRVFEPTTTLGLYLALSALADTCEGGYSVRAIR